MFKRQYSSDENFLSFSFWIPYLLSLTRDYLQIVVSGNSSNFLPNYIKVTKKSWIKYTFSQYCFIPIKSRLEKKHSFFH